MKTKLFSLILFSIVFYSCSSNNDPTIDEEKPLEQQEEKPYDEIGALKGYFSVSPTTKVRFSRGNLEYRASTDTWRFAEEQYLYSGKTTISATSDTWFSVFGWATSGYNKKYPYLNGDRYSDGYYTERKDITNTEYDWGVYNVISNGGNMRNLWRTLSATEWAYIINGRQNYYEKFGFGTINGTRGIILLPDDKPILSFEFKPYAKNIYRGNDVTKVLLDVNCEMQDYTIEQWKEMEREGCVFLPGTVNESSLYFYWTSSYVSDQSMAYAFAIKQLAMGNNDSFTCLFHKARNSKQQVRLVTNY